MQDMFLKLYVNAKSLMNDDRGQDMIEYILVGAMVALAATAGMTSLATSLNAAFNTIGGKLEYYSNK